MNVGVTDDADRVQQHSRKISKNGSFMFLSATPYSSWNYCRIGIGWWAVLLRSDGGDVWVSSIGAGWIGILGSWRG